MKRVVLTSAFHAVSWGHPHRDHVFTEDDWSMLDGPVGDAYTKSKTLSEQAAWDFVRTSGTATELVTLLPVAVMGPMMGHEVSGANEIALNMLKGAVPALPHLYIPIVDVRDVAAAHVCAMTQPQAAGQRFLISNGPAMELKDIAATIRAEVGAASEKVPTRVVPNAVVRVAAIFDRRFKQVVPDLGYSKKTSNEKARRLLHWSPRDPREAIASAARSMIANGLLTT